MIELTDEIQRAYAETWFRTLGVDEEDVQRAVEAELREPMTWRLAALQAVLDLVEREHVILPRGAQPLCCGEHPDAVVRWGECPVCVAETPPEERT